MQMQIFNVPLTDTGESMAELKRFLGGHKVLEVEQRFHQNEKGACWIFCVRYLPTAANPKYPCTVVLTVIFIMLLLVF